MVVHAEHFCDRERWCGGVLQLGGETTPCFSCRSAERSRDFSEAATYSNQDVSSPKHPWIHLERHVCVKHQRKTHYDCNMVIAAEAVSKQAGRRSGCPWMHCGNNVFSAGNLDEANVTLIYVSIPAKIKPLLFYHPTKSRQTERKKAK